MAQIKEKLDQLLVAVGSLGQGAKKRPQDEGERQTMSYIDNTLMSGESVIYRAKLHWIVFAWPVIWLIATVLLFAGGGAAAGGLFLLFAILTGIASFIAYSTSEFGITDRRVLVKVGFIRRNTLEVLLSKVEGIQVNQSITGRILDFGSVVVSGTGGTKDPFHKISAPLEFRRKAQEQIAAAQGQALPQPAQDSGQERACPQCGETIKKIAKICKHCKSTVTPI